MKRILLVKTSSLGDVVHNLPVVDDIRSRHPGARIDWAVEEAYAPVVALHPGVHRALPVAIRRWRKQLLGRATWDEIGAFRRHLRLERYDLVIDTQGLVKSALVASGVPGEHHGFDARSAREPLAARFYDCRHPVPRDEHAVTRNRLLVGAALGYRPAAQVEYGLPPSAARPAGAGYAVLLHATSRADKLWPEAHWVALGRSLAPLQVVLPHGNDEELARGRRLAAGIPGASVPERMPVAAMAALLAGARCVVGVDTGLTHLAAALGVPVAAIYTATDPSLTGVFGAARALNLGGLSACPAPDEVLGALRSLAALD